MAVNDEKLNVDTEKVKSRIESLLKKARELQIGDIDRDDVVATLKRYMGVDNGNKTYWYSFVVSDDNDDIVMEDCGIVGNETDEEELPINENKTIEEKLERILVSLEIIESDLAELKNANNWKDNFRIDLPNGYRPIF